MIEGFNEEFKKKLSSLRGNATYKSHKIQNKILSIFARMILEEISNEVQSSDCYSIMADETRDLSKTEQIFIIVRYFLNGVIHERFLGFEAASKLNANALFKYIKKYSQNK